MAIKPAAFAPSVVAILTSLVAMAEESLRGRGYSRLEQIEPLHGLKISVEREVMMPRDTERFIQNYTYSLVMGLIELEQARDVHDDDNAAVWQQICGVLLPVVRRDLARAMREKVAA